MIIKSSRVIKLELIKKFKYFLKLLKILKKYSKWYQTYIRVKDIYLKKRKW